MTDKLKWTPTDVLKRHERCGTEFCTLHAAAPDLYDALLAAPEPPLEGTPHVDDFEAAYTAWFRGPRVKALRKAKP